MHSIRGYSKLFGILGNPIQHSLSPIVHNILLQQTDYAKSDNGVYIPLQCEENSLETVLKATKTLPFVGLNVTSPYKKKVIPFLDKLSSLSQSIKSVNTIYWNERKYYGTSTDGIGFIKGFEKQGFSFQQKTVAVLGTGGVAQAVLQALSQQQCTKIFLVSRTPSTTEQIQYLNLESISYQQYSDVQKKIDIVVNCTPLGMAGNTQSPLTSQQIESYQCVYDLIYESPTVLLQNAQFKKATTLNGLGMLVYQAIASFKIWTGTNSVDSESVFKQIKSFLK